MTSVVTKRQTNTCHGVAGDDCTRCMDREAIVSCIHTCRGIRSLARKNDDRKRGTLLPYRICASNQNSNII
jgi:hypothetical protein